MQNFGAAPRSEYLPSEDENNDSPRSEASRKAWETSNARAVAQSKKTPYDLRRQVSLCKDKLASGKPALTQFAKLLFCRLTDMAFEPEYRRGDGIVCVSKPFLAADFDVCEDTVRRAARQLEVTGFLWTKTFWNGSFEITWFFIREWADDSKEYDPHTGSNFGSRVRRIQRNTLRGQKGKFAPNPDSQRQKILRLLAANGYGPPPVSTVKAEISGVNGDKSAVSGLTSQPCQGAAVSPVTAHQSAVTPLTSQPCQGAPVSPDTVQPSAVTPLTSQPCQGGPVSGLNTLKTITGEGEEEPFKRSTGLNAQKAGRGGQQASREKVFLLDVGAMMERWRKGSSKAELTNSGAWWRMAFRADADLMERVLGDTLGAVKEGRIKQTPGQHAADTWKRWGGHLEAKP